MLMLLANAPTAAQTGAARTGNPLSLLLTIGLFFAVFYFFMIRPQQKQQKKRLEMLNAMSVGDDAVTIGGLHGKIATITDDEIVLDVASGVHLTFERSAIARTSKKD